MCFSATASFTASAFLLLCGISALYRAQKKQYLFAMIPLLFSLQQFIEGVIWQSLSAGSAAPIATYTYLAFVFIVWPNWIPLSLFFMTTRPTEKKIMTLPFLAGICTSILALTYITSAYPHAVIEGYHIKYTMLVPTWLFIPGTLLYLIATLMPFFLVSVPHLWLLGVILAISYLISLMFYFTWIVSMWCFFAAILSIFIIILVGKS